ncbi:MAG: hypothetical protein RL077_3889 [Verrucomicrobiota bacterium]
MYFSRSRDFGRRQHRGPRRSPEGFLRVRSSGPRRPRPAPLSRRGWGWLSAVFPIIWRRPRGRCRCVFSQISGSAVIPRSRWRWTWPESSRPCGSRLMMGVNRPIRRKGTCSLNAWRRVCRVAGSGSRHDRIELTNALRGRRWAGRVRRRHAGRLGWRRVRPRSVHRSGRRGRRTGNRLPSWCQPGFRNRPCLRTIP